MPEQILWVIGSLIFLLLGALHLFYTFFTNKFSSRNEEMISEMKKSFPNLSRETTMWKAWVGFNASHSAGAIFIGSINLILAAQHFVFLRQSFPLMLLTLLTVTFYLFLGKKYWFRIPFIGILISTICFALSFLLILL
jgi:hypothetical protein